MMVRIGQAIDGILCQVALCLDDCHCYTSPCSLQARNATQEHVLHMVLSQYIRMHQSRKDR